jgi:predicted PurR-regulated permease PerM
VKTSQNLSGIGGWFLLICVFLALVFSYMVLKPFLMIFLMAFVLAIISYPAYSRFLRWSRQRENLSSLLTCILVVLLIIVPSLGLLLLLARESIQFYQWIDDRIKAGILDTDLLNRLIKIQKDLFPRLQLDQAQLGKTLTSLAARLSGFLVGISASILKAVTTTIWQFILMLISLFYFLKDGGRFLRWVMHIVPLPSSLEKEIFQKFKEVSESAFRGTFATALAQGFLGGIGFLIVGLQPVVWGIIMAFFSMIPMVGTAIVWLPAAVLLILSHKVLSGIFLIVWGVLVVGLSDNLIRPILMRGKSQLHPMLIFFSLLGGMMAFGPMGILLGPLAIVLTISMLRAYEDSASSFLEELDSK